MEKYFIMNGSQQLGPFTIEEIKAAGYPSDTYAYSKTLGGWKKLSEIPAYFNEPKTEPTPLPPRVDSASIPSPTATTNSRVNQPSQNKPPKSWLTESILATLFCCLPFGIAGIVNASKVESRFAAGDITGAQRASEQAGKWTKISFWIGLVIVIINLIGVFAGAY